MRKKIILRLTALTKKLMSHTHSQDDSAHHLDENNDDAVALCDALEIAFLHGVRIAEFGGALPSWKLLEKLENATPVCIPLRNSVGAIASVGSLKSAVGRTRGWIRQILNVKCVEECMHYIITEHSRALGEFYHPEAMVCHKGDANILVSILKRMCIYLNGSALQLFACRVDKNMFVLWIFVPSFAFLFHVLIIGVFLFCSVFLLYYAHNRQMNVLRSLKVMAFNFKVGNNDSLNSVPAWLSAAAAAARPPMISPPRQATQSSTSSGGGGGGGGGMLNSFFSSFLSKAGSAANAATDFISNTIEVTSAELVANTLQAEAALARNNRMRHGTEGTVRHASLSGTSFFQSTSLCDLLLDEKRCTHANLNPLLGVPTQATRLINFLLNYVSTPNLFRARSTPALLEAVRRAAEDEKNLPSSADAAAVAKVLIDWLNQLPEPLFGFQHYEAIIACQQIENEDARIRNLAVLLLDSPWYCKPLMLKLMTLLNECLKPENAAINNLNSWAVAVMCSPFLLRSEQQQNMRARRTFLGLTPEEQEEDDQVQMAAAAAGSGVVEFIITHSSAVLSRVRADLAAEHKMLVAKCQRIRILQEQVVDILNVKSAENIDRSTQLLIISLFDALCDAEKLISFTPSAGTAGREASSSCPTSSVQQTADDNTVSDGMNLSAVLSNKRWDICGFPTKSSSSTADQNSSPLRDFQGPGGALALQCVVGFFLRYRPKAAAVVSDFAQNRHKFCTFPQTVVRLMHFSAEVLELSPNIASSSSSSSSANSVSHGGGSPGVGEDRSLSAASSMEYLAKRPCWALLGHDMCLFVSQFLIESMYGTHVPMSYSYSYSFYCLLFVVSYTADVLMYFAHICFYYRKRLIWPCSHLKMHGRV